MYRIPEDASLTLRTTWLRTTTGWVQFEDRIPWAQQNPKTPTFAVWGDRGVFVFESGTKINPKLSAKATPVITQDPGLGHGSPRDTKSKPSPEDEWASLWDETRKAKGKLKVSGGHRVGWLHDMIQTTPFCDFRVTSERRSDSILSIKEGAHGIVINTSVDSSGEKIDGSHSRSLFVTIRHPRSLACRAGRKQLAVAIKIIGIVEHGSHCSSCIVGHGPHYAMASTADQSAATPTPNQYAERLLPYLRTYPAQGSTQASFIKAWIVGNGAACSSVWKTGLSFYATAVDD